KCRQGGRVVQVMDVLVGRRLHCEISCVTSCEPLLKHLKRGPSQDLRPLGQHSGSLRHPADELDVIQRRSSSRQRCLPPCATAKRRASGSPGRWWVPARAGESRPPRVLAERQAADRRPRAGVRSMVTQADVLRYLNSLDFPASRDDIVNEAEREGASPDVVRALRGMGLVDYGCKYEGARSAGT